MPSLALRVLRDLALLLAVMLAMGAVATARAVPAHAEEALSLTVTATGDLHVRVGADGVARATYTVVVHGPAGATHPGIRGWARQPLGFELPSYTVDGGEPMTDLRIPEGVLGPDGRISYDVVVELKMTDPDAVVWDSLGSCVIIAPGTPEGGMRLMAWLRGTGTESFGCHGIVPFDSTTLPGYPVGLVFLVEGEATIDAQGHGEAHYNLYIYGEPGSNHTSVSVTAQPPAGVDVEWIQIGPDLRVEGTSARLSGGVIGLEGETLYPVTVGLHVPDPDAVDWKRVSICWGPQPNGSSEDHGGLLVTASMPVDTEHNGNLGCTSIVREEEDSTASPSRPTGTPPPPQTDTPTATIMPTGTANATSTTTALPTASETSTRALRAAAPIGTASALVAATATTTDAVLPTSDAAATSPALPRTGADVALTGLLAAGVLGLGAGLLVLRRL